VAQTSDIPVSMRCLCATVRRAARLLNRKYEEALAPAGVTPGQFEMMMVLRHAGPADQTKLASLLETDQTTLSRNLRLMEKERWIVEERSAADARKRIYRLTSLGGSVLAEAQRRWHDVHAQMERELGEPMSQLWPTLDRILMVARAPSGT
jgi:DNA-binding MarR family transcriptional regulator